MDPTGWQQRFDDLARRHRVPGASLAVLAAGEVTALATGVLHLGTGVAATTDSLFQIGSITKPYTAALVLRLVDQGLVRLDAPVVDVLPDFRVADAEVSGQVTLRHLLAHSSGIAGDFPHDTGRGDDCLARYVAACAELPQTHPLGATMSYCNAGYVVVGRMIEQLTGLTWDEALMDHVVSPLGLTHTWTLPEDVLRFRAAMGHVTPSSGGDPRPAPTWSLPRSDGPAGAICAIAADVVAFAVSTSTTTEMHTPQIAVPNPHPIASHWGLGWALATWDSRRVFGHTGDTIGQSAFVRVIPDCGVAIGLLTNSDQAEGLYRDVCAALVRELCGIAMPGLPEPPPDPPDVDVSRYVGRYARLGRAMDVRPAGDGLVLHITQLGDLPLVPVTDSLFVTRHPVRGRPISVVFHEAADGRMYLHDGARATPRVSSLEQQESDDG